MNLAMPSGGASTPQDVSCISSCGVGCRLELQRSPQCSEDPRWSAWPCPVGAQVRPRTFPVHARALIINKACICYRLPCKRVSGVQQAPQKAHDAEPDHAQWCASTSHDVSCAAEAFTGHAVMDCIQSQGPTREVQHACGADAPPGPAGPPDAANDVSASAQPASCAAAAPLVAGNALPATGSLHASEAPLLCRCVSRIQQARQTVQVRYQALHGVRFLGFSCIPCCRQDCSQLDMRSSSRAEAHLDSAGISRVQQACQAVQVRYQTLHGVRFLRCCRTSRCR